MIFEETPLGGAYLLRPERHQDERGWFARVWDRDEFQERGLDVHLTQCNVSFNERKGTLRGMHWQAAPHGEVKLVGANQGAAYDVIVDIRRDSPTYRKWFGARLDATGGTLLYVPKGFAHGFLTLEDRTEILYLMTGSYHPPAERGARWNDPSFAISWPFPPIVISLRDASFLPFES